MEVEVEVEVEVGEAVEAGVVKAPSLRLELEMGMEMGEAWLTTTA